MWDCPIELSQREPEISEQNLPVSPYFIWNEGEWLQPLVCWGVQWWYGICCSLQGYRSLDGLFLTAFDSHSIRVSVSSLGEVNRLRKTHRPDLPLFTICKVSKRKRKLTGIDKSVTPSTKKAKPNPTSDKDSEDCVITHTEIPAITPLWLHSVDIQWQQSACQQPGLQHTTEPRFRPGGANLPLTRPDMRSIRHIYGDGNCLFRAFSYILIGSEEQHLAVRTSCYPPAYDKQCPILSRSPSHRVTSHPQVWTEMVPGGLKLRCWAWLTCCRHLFTPTASS